MTETGIGCINWDSEDITNSSPILLVSINMVKITLLIDTGASLSFMDRRFVDKNTMLKLFEVKRDKSWIVNALGKEVVVDSILHTKNMHINGAVFEHDFVIMDLDAYHENKDMVYHGIVGFDFLIRHGITLDFSNFSLLIP